MTDIRIAVAGAAGRMGAANIRALAETDGVILHSAFDQKASPAIGSDASVLAGLQSAGIQITSDAVAAINGADCVLDFTVPAATLDLAALCASVGVAHVIGTTGMTASEEDALAGIAGARILKAGNMSLGINLLMDLIRRAATALGPQFDIEIVEMHHRRKIDAPSGTALMLGEAAAEGRGVKLADNAVRGRDGITGARREGTIGFSAIRGGSIIGDHRALFAGPGERIEIAHISEDRSLFANGAVRAAIWLHDRKPGHYTMADVLGTNDRSEYL